MGDYNKFAKKYANLTEKSEKETRKKFYKKLKINLKNKILLDVGCGSGQDIDYYIKKGAIAYGLDISEKEIEIAKKHYNKAKFTVADMQSLPYPNNKFNIVTSFYALQTSNNVIKVLK